MKEKLKIGFALLDKESRRRNASKGGKKAHELGRAHQWTSEQARAAGKKGGKANADRLRLKRLNDGRHSQEQARIKSGKTLE